MGILDLVFPRSCLGCGREDRYICADCLKKVRPAGSICPNCGRTSFDGATHPKCVRRLGLDGLISIWRYEGVVRRAIIALKYKYATKIGEELTEYLVGLLKTSSIPGNYTLVPIPLYWYRKNNRGFNQSIEVGKVVAVRMGWRFLPELLVKKKSTLPQASLTGRVRRDNLENAFAVDSRFKIPDSVLLFDDVFTTGSTLREATKGLKRAGVKSVWGLTIAR